MKNTRRHFLRTAASGILTTFLVACGMREQPSPPAPALPTSTIAPSPVPTEIAPMAAAANTSAATTPLTFAIPEMPGRPTNNSLTLNVIPDNAIELYGEYGTAPGVYTMRTTAQALAANTPREIVLEGLQPDTRYYYRLRAGDTATAERTFVTQRAPGSSFVFNVQGDSHPERVRKQFDATLYERALKTAAADQPDFYITIGDDFSVDNLKSIDAEIVRGLYLKQRQWLGLVGAPVFLGNGNHEQASMANLDGTPNNVAVWAQTARNSLYPQPAPDAFYSGNSEPVEFIGLLRDYWSFTWGDALFVMIDPYWHSPQTVDNQFGASKSSKQKRDLWNITLGEKQYQWFKQTLENSRAKYKFVFSHHVLGTGRGGIERAGAAEWGDTKNLAANRPGWTKTIHQLMADHHVNFFFQGHDHIFVHQELDGVIYQTLPVPADPNYALLNGDAYESGHQLPNSGYLRLNVSPETVKVEYVRTVLPQDEQDGNRHGEIAYTYNVT